MKRLFALTLLASAACSAHGENGALLMSINNIGNEHDNQLLAQDMAKDFVRHLENGSATRIRVVTGSDATIELQRTRTGYYDLILAPAHIIASAVKNEYIPVASINGTIKAQLVTRKDAGIDSLARMKGKRLCMPAADSLGTYLAKGMMNDQGITPKSHFSEVKYARYDQSCLYALDNKLTDVIATTDNILKAHHTASTITVVLESKPVPNVSLAVNKRVPEATREKIQQAALGLKDKTKGSLLSKFQAERCEVSAKENFDYVAKLGYHTPSRLPGATPVTAKDAQDLMTKGVKLYDTRSEHEYKENHIPGAISLSYQEKSDKTPDFDPTLDKFDLTKLPGDKNVPIIFACNGAECWKSYKASVLAMRSGHTKVYWFRGGLPEWKKEGYAVENKV